MDKLTSTFLTMNHDVIHYITSIVSLLILVTISLSFSRTQEVTQTITFFCRVSTSSPSPSPNNQDAAMQCDQPNGGVCARHSHTVVIS